MMKNSEFLMTNAESISNFSMSKILNLSFDHWDFIRNSGFCHSELKQ